MRNRYGALLKSLVFCKACDRTMVHTFTGRGRNSIATTPARTPSRADIDRCPSGSLPAAEIERVVVDQIRCIAHDPPSAPTSLEQGQGTHRTRTDGTAVESTGYLARELARHHAEIKRLAIEGPANGATTARIADLHERVARAETRLAELNKQIGEIEREQLEEDDVAAAFTDFDNVWNALSPREQAQLLALLVARVEFNAEDNTIAVTFHPTGIKSLAEGRHEEAA